jgi:hypothetical protein
VEDRQTRLARYLTRSAASYDHACFQMWLWYPCPDGTWEILFGDRGGDYHLYLWEGEGIRAMAKAWGVDPYDLGSGIGLDAIPTGYIDFTERMGRESLILVVPDPMPPGWDTIRLKKLLRCGDQIRQTHASTRRAADQAILKQMIEILKELQLQRPVNY